MIGTGVAFVGKRDAAGSVELAAAKVDRVGKLQLQTIIFDVEDFHPKTRTVTQVLTDRPSEMPDHDRNLPDRQLIAQQNHIAFQQRLPVDFQQRFRYRLGVRVGSNAATGSRYDAVQLRHGPRVDEMPQARKQVKGTTDIVIPTCNEAATIPDLLRRLRAACPAARLIFVDNASTDTTVDLLREAGIADIVQHAENLGYGRSLLDGMRHGDGEHVVVIDADLEYSPEDIPAMLARLSDADAVIGSRFLQTGTSAIDMQRYRSLGNGLVTGLFNLLFRQNLTDLYTGVRAFNRSALPLDDLQSSGFEFVLELSARLVSAGVEIVETPVEYTPRSTGASKMKHVPEFLRFGRRLITLRAQLGGSRSR